jgi:hypothetical protein
LPLQLALTTRWVDAGDFSSLLAGRTGRLTSSPAQLGQIPCSLCSLQSWQNVHSKEHIMASSEDTGKSLSQHSQLGRNSNIASVLKMARKNHPDHKQKPPAFGVYLRFCSNA